MKRAREKKRVKKVKKRKKVKMESGRKKEVYRRQGANEAGRGTAGLVRVGFRVGLFHYIGEESVCQGAY